MKMTFFEQAWQIVSKIPLGEVATYGQIASILGTRDARRIGHALHANKDRKVPCRRVVFADGSLAPGYAFGGADEQMKKLKKEGVKFVGEKVDLKKCRWSR